MPRRVALGVAVTTTLPDAGTVGRARVSAVPLVCVLAAPRRTVELRSNHAFDFLRVPLTTVAADLSTRARGRTVTVIHTCAKTAMEKASARPDHAASANARAASISPPTRAATVRRVDTSHLTAIVTALVIAAQVGSTSTPRAPPHAAIAQVAKPPLAAQTLLRIATAHPRARDDARLAHLRTTTRAIRRPARSLSRTAPSNSGACLRLYAVLHARTRAMRCWLC